MGVSVAWRSSLVPEGKQTTGDVGVGWSSRNERRLKEFNGLESLLRLTQRVFPAVGRLIATLLADV
jgi:hypothetical protein